MYNIEPAPRVTFQNKLAGSAAAIWCVTFPRSALYHVSCVRGGFLFALRLRFYIGFEFIILVFNSAREAARMAFLLAFSIILSSSEKRWHITNVLSFYFSGKHPCERES